VSFLIVQQAGDLKCPIGYTWVQFLMGLGEDKGVRRRLLEALRFFCNRRMNSLSPSLFTFAFGSEQALHASTHT